MKSWSNIFLETILSLIVKISFAENKMGVFNTNITKPFFQFHKLIKMG